MEFVDGSDLGRLGIGQRLGAKRFDRWVRRFGFGKPTGVDLPGEEGGIVLRERAPKLAELMDDAREDVRLRHPDGVLVSALTGEGLEELGFVRSSAGAFSLTPKVLTLGMSYFGALGLWEIARPHLEALVRQSGVSLP